jgi:hypothetical protein
MRFAKLGEDALAKLGGVEPNLIAILSDINMPEMDWLDTCWVRSPTLPGSDGYDGNRPWRRRVSDQAGRL